MILENTETPKTTIYAAGVDQQVADPVNMEYYTEISDDMTLLEAPTVRDEIEAMRRRGNVKYFHANKDWKSGILQESFKPRKVKHEVAHLSAKMPHTPEGEFMLLAFERGLTFGTKVKEFNRKQIEELKQIVQYNSNKYEIDAQSIKDGPPPKISKYDAAICFAQGMYLREKVNEFIHKGLINAPYEKQKEFCSNYELQDHTPSVNEDIPKTILGMDYDMDIILDAPNDLIHLSPKEKNAIREVALSICEPEHTCYPQRLDAIKKALVKTETLFDWPRFKEDQEANRIRKNQHSRIKPGFTGDSGALFI